jgi:hypothetical protein
LSTSQVIHRSNIRTACDPSSVKLHIYLLSITEFPVLQSRVDHLLTNTSLDHGEHISASIPKVDYNTLIGRTFLQPHQDDERGFRARIVEAIKVQEN